MTRECLCGEGLPRTGGGISAARSAYLNRRRAESSRVVAQSNVPRPDPSSGSRRRSSASTLGDYRRVAVTGGLIKKTSSYRQVNRNSCNSLNLRYLPFPLVRQGRRLARIDQVKVKLRSSNPAVRATASISTAGADGWSSVPLPVSGMSTARYVARQRPRQPALKFLGLDAAFSR